MIAFVKRLWAAAPIATLVLALALGATGLFGLRAALFWAHRHENIAREQPVAGWMTPGYIAHSWHVPRDVVLEAIDAPQPPPDGPMNLARLAEYTGTPVEVLIAETEAAIAAWRAENAPPGGPAPGLAPGAGPEPGPDRAAPPFPPGIDPAAPGDAVLPDSEGPRP